MKKVILTIHRGSHQIGGSCIELQHGDSRIILDCGLPLEAINDREGAKNSDAWLPEVPGLFKNGPCINGILLSHAHADHHGLIHRSRPEIPVYATKSTFKMLMSASLFAGQHGVRGARERYLKENDEISIGPFEVTSYPVDHSIYGAQAFLIQVGGKKILYTGDMRFHGRKPGMARNLVEACRHTKLDLVITEGTCLGRIEPVHAITEDGLENEAVERINTCKSLALARFSPLNFDRLVTFIRVAKRTGRALVIDPYAAYVLHLAKCEGRQVPDPFNSRSFLDWHIRTLLLKGYHNSRAGKALSHYKDWWAKSQVHLKEIMEDPAGYLMLWRPSMLETVFGGQLPHGSLCLYSLWSGYLKQEKEQELLRKFEAMGVEQQVLHASGHAYRADLVSFLKAIQAKSIIVVHSEKPEALKEELEYVRTAEDGVPMEL